MTDAEGGYELVMPFVTVVSKGGPHDDASYVAGYECGRLDVELERSTNRLILRTVRAENLPQLDLIAMQHRRVIHIVTPDLNDNPDETGWVTILISTRSETEESVNE